MLMFQLLINITSCQLVQSEWSEGLGLLSVSFVYFFFGLKTIKPHGIPVLINLECNVSAFNTLF